jgi:hypothetical protein
MEQDTLTVNFPESVLLGYEFHMNNNDFLRLKMKNKFGGKICLNEIQIW